MKVQPRARRVYQHFGNLWWWRKMHWHDCYLLIQRHMTTGSRTRTTMWIAGIRYSTRYHVVCCKRIISTINGGNINPSLIHSQIYINCFRMVYRIDMVVFVKKIRFFFGFLASKRINYLTLIQSIAIIRPPNWIVLVFIYTLFQSGIVSLKFYVVPLP